MKKVFAYTRVSTVRQGEHGVSLQEQRDAIERYALRNGLTVNGWFEDRLTATVQGRPGFDRMLRDLNRERSSGVIIHKVDRSARNLGDWNEVTELLDRGFDVHIAHEAIDLRSRSGRLTGDILAVMAADYSRNLREEVRKGIDGRLKQGLFPRPAPLGYRDNGGGQPKTIDPSHGPLVRQLFQSYATGRVSLRGLTAQAIDLRLRGRGGKALRLSQVAQMMRNPFYTGLIRVQRTGQVFHGVHEPLVSKAVFDQVQRVLDGKGVKGTHKHAYLFRRLLRCAHFSMTLTGERQKGRIYYRCHTNDCPTTTVREDVVEAEFRRLLAGLRDAEEWRDELRTHLDTMRTQIEGDRRKRQRAKALRAAQLSHQERRLTDAYLEGLLDKAQFEQRKRTLEDERHSLENHAGPARADGTGEAGNFLELASKAHLLYERAVPEEQRELFELMTSNRVVDGRKPVFMLCSPFADLLKPSKMQTGGPHRNTARTGSTLRRALQRLLKISRGVPVKVVERTRTLLDRETPARPRRPGGTVLRRGLLYLPTREGGVDLVVDHLT